MSAEITFDPAVNSKTGQIEFTAEPITLEILSAFGKTGDDDAIQTLRIPLPSSCKIPVPRLSIEQQGGCGRAHPEPLRPRPGEE